jgi:hypothetical protein
MEFKRPLAAFYSYSHKDRRHLDDLIPAMAAYRRNGDLDDWDDRKIHGGQKWEEELVERARNSRLFLLLVTNYFVDSDYCVNRELMLARTLLERQVAAVAPIIVEDCNWKIEGLEDLQAILPFDKPVRSTRKARAWTEVGRKIKDIADALVGGTYFKTASPKTQEVPVLMPFSIGRSAEENDFQTRLAAADLKQPFVCILTGAREGQHEFVELLAAAEGPIRRTLGLYSAAFVLTIYDQYWIQSTRNLEGMLNLAIAPLLDPPPASAQRDAVAAAIAGHPGLSMIHFIVTGDAWRAAGAARLLDFLQYWVGWPELKLDRPLIIFLTIKADIDQLDVAGAIWQPLSSIRREAIDEWLDAEPLRRRFWTDRIKEDLDGWLPAGKSIPMEELAAKLLPLLKKHQR